MTVLPEFKVSAAPSLLSGVVPEASVGRIDRISFVVNRLRCRRTDARQRKGEEIAGPRYAAAGHYDPLPLGVSGLLESRRRTSALA